MDVGDLLKVLAIVMAVVAGGAITIVGLLMWRYRIPPRGLVAIGAALLYLVSPVDVLPEALLGPLGLVDDAGVLAVAIMWALRIAQVRRVLRDGGVIGPDRVPARPHRATSPRQARRG